MRQGRHPEPLRAARGFTFIEILIVMGVIAVLMGGVLVAINIWGRKGPELATRTRIGQLEAMANAFRHKFDVLPPTRVKDLPTATGLGEPIKGAMNESNEGIEALLQAFQWPGFKASTSFGEAETSNTDEDELDKAVAAGVSKALLEVVDGWGNPFVYVNSQDYGRYANGGLDVVLGSTEIEGVEPGDAVEAQPHRNAEGMFRNPNSFQIFSLGADGQPNTDDDLGNWSE